jgi:hypothetical protein
MTTRSGHVPLPAAVMHSPRTCRGAWGTRETQVASLGGGTHRRTYQHPPGTRPDGPRCRGVVSDMQECVRYGLLSVIGSTVSGRVRPCRDGSSARPALVHPCNSHHLYSRDAVTRPGTIVSAQCHHEMPRTSEDCHVVRCRVGCVTRLSCLPPQSKLQSRSLQLPPRTAHFNTVPHDPRLGSNLHEHPGLCS